MEMVFGPDAIHAGEWLTLALIGVLGFLVGGSWNSVPSVRGLKALTIETGRDHQFEFDRWHDREV
jgi:hypothetical protein